MNRVLYQFPLSHYCEKARWLLDFKDLEYSVKNLFPATHRIVTLWKANSTTVPLVKDGKEWIGDSTELAFYIKKNVSHAVIGEGESRAINRPVNYGQR